MLRPLALLVACALAPAPERTFAFAYEADWTVELVGEGSSTLTLGDVAITLNGEELPPEALGDPDEMFGLDEEETETVEVSTRVVAVADGLPTVVEHELRVLRATRDADGESEETTGPLEGRRVRVSAGEDGATTVELLGEDGEPTESVDDELPLHPRLASLLPTEEVSEGDSWSPGEGFLDPDADEDLGWFSADLGNVDEEDEDRGPEQLFQKALEEVQPMVTWTSTEELADERIATLLVEFEFDFDLLEVMGDEFEIDDMPEGSSASSDASFRFHYELDWSLTHGRPHAMRATMVFDADMTFELPVEEGVDMVMQMDFQGAFERSSGWTYGR